MVSCLEEGLLDVKHTINVENGHNIESHVFKQVIIVIVVMEDTMKELENYVEWHLNRDSLTCMMSSSEKHSRSLTRGLCTSLKFNQRNITSFVCLTEASDCNVVWELFLQLLNDGQRVMIAVMIAKTRDEQLVLDSVVEFGAMHHLFCK